MTPLEWARTVTADRVHSDEFVDMANASTLEERSAFLMVLVDRGNADTTGAFARAVDAILSDVDLLARVGPPPRP